MAPETQLLGTQFDGSSIGAALSLVRRALISLLLIILITEVIAERILCIYNRHNEEISLTWNVTYKISDSLHSESVSSPAEKVFMLLRGTGYFDSPKRRVRFVNLSETLEGKTVGSRIQLQQE